MLSRTDSLIISYIPLNLSSGQCDFFHRKSVELLPIGNQEVGCELGSGMVLIFLNAKKSIR